MATIHAIIGDLGATHSRIASILKKGDKTFVNVDVFSSKAFPSPIELISTYCEKYKIKTFSILKLAVAAPIHNDRLSFVNIHWEFSISEISNHFSHAEVIFINDVEAQAQAIPFLDDHQKIQVGTGQYDPYAPSFTMALGSGVGTALTLYRNNDWWVIPSEGGHAGFAPESLEDIKWLSNSFTQSETTPIIEQFISGSIGIPNLVKYIYKEKGVITPSLSPTLLLHNLITEKDPIILAIFQRYCAIIGAIARDFILITGAKSLFLSGGIIPQFLPFFVASEFRISFENSSALSQYLRSIPTYVITDPYPALVGLVHTL